MKKIIFNLAPTGMIPTKKMTPYVPVSIDEIVKDIIDCISLGVNMVHIHARDEDGNPTYKKHYYEAIIPEIRKIYPEIIITVTTSGRTFNKFEQRSEVLSLCGTAKPDMASLTLSSLNFNKVASINSPKMIMQLAEKMQENEIKPELEVFDLGMINYAKYLIKKGLLTPPYYFNLILGNIAAAQAKIQHLGLLVQELPEQSLWSVAGIGNSQLDMNTIGAVAGNGLRTGLEDNIWFDEQRSVLATNQMLVKRMVVILQALQRPIATAIEVRKMLGISMLEESHE